MDEFTQHKIKMCEEEVAEWTKARELLEVHRCIAIVTVETLDTDVQFDCTDKYAKFLTDRLYKANTRLIVGFKNQDELDEVFNGCDQ